MRQRPARAPKRQAAGAAVLQPDVTRAIRRALFHEWAKNGYATLSIEAVARRAGVGKAAIYRRWPSKLEMVAGLFAEVGLEVMELADTGSLRGDLSAFLVKSVALLRRPLIARILTDLSAEMLRTPELVSAMRARAQIKRRIRGEAILRRAMDRGELSPSLDVDLALDLLIALPAWRLLVTRQTLPPDYLEKLTAIILGGLQGLSG